jgi:ribosomal peptide maturation radical SAM protein 1
MPLSSADYPSLALGLLKAAAAASGIECDVRYFSLDYIAAIGLDAFACVSDLAFYTALIGEWVFAAAVHDADPDADDPAYLLDALGSACPDGKLVARLMTILQCRQNAAAFVDWCVDQTDWTRYAVLGITTSFQQNMASLALAKRVKARHPAIRIVLGGANCQGEMGLELHRRYTFVDAVCLGEGDIVFPELLARYLAGEAAPCLPGIAVRGPDGATVLAAGEGGGVENMDDLPYPDLTDFYTQHAARPTVSRFRPVTVFETARGCWWGAKHHCTFCGLNGRQMAYRSKSQGRAYAELSHIVAAYGSSVVNTDAILDMAYFDEFLPRLAAEGPDVTLYWQMKANLRPDHMAILARAGVRRIQPGIEALDTTLLTLMNKGCTMLQNVQTLKLAAEHGITVAWNLLYGFPGEDPEAYRRTAALIPKLRHLQPPNGMGRVLADRFSPYFNRPEAFGIRLEPAPGYRAIHPFDDESIARLAYHFDMHSDELARGQEAAAPMAAEQRLWNEHHPDSALYWTEQDGGIAVADERWGWPREIHWLDGADADLLRLCAQITSRNRIRDTLSPRHAAAAIDAALANLAARGLLIAEDDYALALPLRQPGWRRAPSWDELRQLPAA